MRIFTIILSMTFMVLASVRPAQAGGTDDTAAMTYWADANHAQTDADSFEHRIADFLTLLPGVSSDSARVEAVRNAVSALRNPDASAIVLSQTVETILFDNTSPAFDEDLFAIFLKAMVDASYPDAERSQWLLEMITKNKPGTRVTDFVFTDRTGSRRTLSSVLGRTTVLFFYDPGCDDCHEAAARMAADSALAERIDAGKVQVVAISPVELSEWQETESGFPASWIDGCDGGHLDADGVFLFGSFPTIYFLSPDGTVVLKDTTIDRVLAEVGSL